MRYLNVDTRVHGCGKLHRLLPGLLAKYILILLPVLLAGCVKNEFTLEGTLTDAEGQTLTLIHRASSKKQDFMVEQTLPVEFNGHFSVKLSTNYPTVIWVLSTFDGNLLMPIYAERGDELKVTGKFKEPQRWKVEGNEVMEQYSEWAAANINALMSDNPSILNDAIAKYVKEHPDSRTAAFLLFTRYNVPGHLSEYQNLVKALTLDEDDLKEMENACMDPQLPIVNGATIPAKLTLTAMNDSLKDVNLKGEGTTLLYFWRETPSPEVREVLKKGGRSVSIFMDADTLRWHQLLRTDSLLNKTIKLWAPGGEVTPEVQSLNVTGTPYFIIIDNTGHPIYTGTDPKSVASKL
ncbi:MAG: DUF4369 domain-containing protein [Muribaculaceae bacterium]|nr:DUF4369 domain-containing protein [Muribaculaceae bacterium]